MVANTMLGGGPLIVGRGSCLQAPEESGQKMQLPEVPAGGHVQVQEVYLPCVSVPDKDLHRLQPRQGLPLARRLLVHRDQHASGGCRAQLWRRPATEWTSGSAGPSGDEQPGIPACLARPPSWALLCRCCRLIFRLRMGHILYWDVCG